MAQTLTEIKALLAAHGLRPLHRHGQNFLHDANQMAKIVAAAEVAPGDLVLEVGPGTGALSEWLLDAGARLVAVEIDCGLEPILRDRLEGRGAGTTLVFTDVLAGKRAVEPAVLDALRTAGASGSPAEDAGHDAEPPAVPPFKLVANLPYHVASPLLANLVSDHPSMSLAVVMVQREVADRLTAPPGGKAYGPLGVLVQALCEAERVATLPPGCFWPPPEVDSAVVRLRRRARPLTGDPVKLGALLQRLFGRRRKQIGSILGRGTPLPAGIDPAARPEQLTVAQLVALSEALPPAVEPR